MSLKDEVEIYARVKADDDEYKDQMLACIKKSKSGMDIYVKDPEGLKDILKDLGVIIF